MFANAAVPDGKSSDVLNFQIPQVPLFVPSIVTMSVGGDDLLVPLAAPDPAAAAPAVLAGFAVNLGTIVTNLCFVMPPSAEIYLNNLYSIPEIENSDLIDPFLNSTMNDGVAGVKILPACANK